MYEVGKERVDGKFNVWMKKADSPYSYVWVITRIFASQEEAMSWAALKNKGKKQHYNDTHQ